VDGDSVRSITWFAETRHRTSTSPRPW
jgi:hypothetical protein